MRVNEMIPAWAQRQKNRRLGRHNNEMVVRWIALTQTKDESDTARSQESVASFDGNVVVFANSRMSAS